MCAWRPCLPWVHWGAGHHRCCAISHLFRVTERKRHLAILSCCMRHSRVDKKNEWRRRTACCTAIAPSLRSKAGGGGVQVRCGSSLRRSPLAWASTSLTSAPSSTGRSPPASRYAPPCPLPLLTNRSHVLPRLESLVAALGAVPQRRRLPRPPVGRDRVIRTRHACMRQCCLVTSMHVPSPTLRLVHLHMHPCPYVCTYAWLYPCTHFQY